MKSFLILILTASCLIAGPRGSLDPRSALYGARVKANGNLTITQLSAQKLQRFIVAVSVNSNWSLVRGGIYYSYLNVIDGSNTVTTFGGLSADRRNVVASPSLTSTGVSLNGTTQYLVDPNDLWGGGTALTVLADFNQANAVAPQNLIACLDSGLFQRSFSFTPRESGGSYRLDTSSNGSNLSMSAWGTVATGVQRTLGCIYNGSSVLGFIDGASQAVTGTPQPSLFNASIPIRIGGNSNSGVPANLFQGTIACDIVIPQTLTTAQFQAINTAMVGLR